MLSHLISKSPAKKISCNLFYTLYSFENARCFSFIVSQTILILIKFIEERTIFYPS
jgi:hypothetical protein